MKPTKLNKLYWWTYQRGREKFSGILFLIETLFLPLNLIVCLITNWKKRLL